MSTTPLPSTTDTPSSTISKTPSAPSLPPNNYSLNVLEWPESGDLILPIDGEVMFPTSIRDLSSGNYLVYLNEEKHEVWYASLETDISGVLLQPNEEMDLPDGIASGLGQFLLYDRARVWRFYDLVDQSAWSVGPICLWEQMSISPDGKWLGTLCEDVQSNENSTEFMTLEIISTYEGTGSRFLIPRVTPDQDIINPFLSWFDFGVLGLSRVWIEDEFRTCHISFLDQFMFCPLIFDPGYLARQMTIFPGGDVIPFTDLKSYPWQSALVPIECLINGERCSGIVELWDIVGVPYASPDPDLLWWISPLDKTEITLLGVYEGPEWESKEIVSMDGSYSIETMCPDGSCVIISDLDSDNFYRLDLDGTVSLLPYEKIIGSFSIP
ncbi:MAG: hypothetical protein ACFFDU_10745 [Candidatus Thorarchaeota archaeon]